jgi:DNA-binding transcriptional MocR family regulator
LELSTDSREGLSIDALRQKTEHHTIGAVLASPHFSNPLGSCMSDERKLELANLPAKADIPLIEDDIYGDLTFQEKRPKNVK